MTTKMKLYMHPVSNASRPVLLFIAENKLDVELKVVDLAKGEHYGDEFTSINPSRQVPVLEDDGFRLTECSAILKYLATKIESPTYPTKDLKKRAKVDEAMDWFNTGFYRDFGYGVVYPQLYPHHKRPSDEVHSGTVDWGKDKANMWFGVLDKHIIGNKPYVCGDQITIADYLGSAFVTMGEVLRCDFSHFPNVTRWVATMKKLPSWTKVNEAHYGFAGAVKDKPFKAITP